MQRVSLLKEANVGYSTGTVNLFSANVGAGKTTLPDKDGWIPCGKENMPPEHEPVLVMYKGKRRIAELDWDIGQADTNFESYQYWGDPDRPGEEELEWEHVTHWQHLPPAIELQ